jgi:hypothetical protein
VCSVVSFPLSGAVGKKRRCGITRVATSLHGCYQGYNVTAGGRVSGARNLIMLECNLDVGIRVVVVVVVVDGRPTRHARLT